MLDVIKALSQTSLAGILAFAGIVFIFLSIGGKLGAQIITDNIQKRYAGIIGVILLISSLGMFVVSTTVQLREPSSTQVETIIDQVVDSVETYKLRPILTTNQPISQVTEFEWTFSPPDKSTKCTVVKYTEEIITILGHSVDGEASVAKRETVSDLFTRTCIVAGKEEAKITKIHGELEGKELLAHKTAEGQWVLDEPPGATEKQKKAMRNDGFMEPFSSFPNEKIPVGIVITFKDEDLSLFLGAVFPGKKEGTAAIKFDRVIREREPVAQFSISMDISVTTLSENDDEIFIKMSLNGGGRLSLSENTKINSTNIVTGIIKAGKPGSPDVAGPATFKLTIKEL